MPAVDTELAFQSLYKRHDLMIELGRLECAIADWRSTSGSNDPAPASSLEARYAIISAVLQGLDE